MEGEDGTIHRNWSGRGVGSRLVPTEAVDRSSDLSLRFSDGATLWRRLFEAGRVRVVVVNFQLRVSSIQIHSRPGSDLTLPWDSLTILTVYRGTPLRFPRENPYGRAIPMNA